MGKNRFQPGTNFRAWIFRILRNSFLTSRAGLRVSRTVPLATEEESPATVATMETPESILIERASQERVQAAIQDLPVIFREALAGMLGPEKKQVNAWRG